jgi:protein gp37
MVRMIRSAGFYRWAWDPIEGCKNGCEYCYAAKEVDEFTTPKFFEERLQEPTKVKPSRIFVNHLSDIMGKWVDREWIEKVIEVCRSLPKHEFLFMTKNPERYKEFEFSDNCILGVTIEKPQYWYRAEMMSSLNSRKMVSIEPIQGSFKGYDFKQFEFVVVGSLINGKVREDLYRTINHWKVYYKR